MKRPAFITIKTEGGLFSADFLQRLASGSSDVPGLTPEAYHLAGREKLNEAASRAWNRLLGIWAAFQDATKNIAATEAATGVTREKWLLPLFNELGYGRLHSARAIELDGRTYSVSHNWQRVPIHLVGLNVELDRRTAGIAGAARISPHGLVQELLNRRHESLWGFVSNGLKLRLLRDNRSLTRQAYVEFDLAAIMEGQAFSDFVLLWLLSHESRVEGEPPDDCWLEKWAKAAREQGTRALEDLRAGVEHAIEALGRGFLKHQANKALLEKLRLGTLDRQDYYRQLLRLVYRLIFLFVSEARDLLLVAEPSSGAAQRYSRYYSISRLRELAGHRRGTPHGDLWQALVVVFRGLSSATGCAELGLPALGSLLWSDAATPDLDACHLSNADLLEAICALAFRLDSGVRRIVDWRNLGPEELGSVYESLLELHPEVNTAGALFSLRVAAGHERKETGSYYTKTGLVECLLDSALDPVLAEAAKSRDPERAILSMRVCDPAVGSGHFLISAAHRIARRLAAVRTGEAEGSPDAVRHALRDVIGHCLYGVDMNPMAVELCKVNLWLEALEPRRPLSFLDHHIQRGNSLLGATPALLRAGIPDAAFDPSEGDDREYSRDLKRWNKTEREGHQNLFTTEPWERIGDLAIGMANLDKIDDSSLEGVREKERRYAQIIRSASYEQGHLLADAWCAAFVWPKTRDAHPIGEDLFRAIERNPMAIPEQVRNEIRRFADEYRFFHWHLSFPDVFRVPPADQPLPDGPGWNGGFDVVLGNPPWDKLTPDSKEFFSQYDESVRFSDRASERAAVDELLTDNTIARNWAAHRRHRFCEVAFLRTSGRYVLFAPGNLGKGDLNTYRFFAELALNLVAANGFAAQFLPEGLYNGANSAAIREALFSKFDLQCIYGFENAREVWFKGIDSRTKFCIYSARRGGRTDTFRAAFNIRSAEELTLAMTGKTLRIPVSLVTEFSPDALSLLEFRGQRDIDISSKMYQLHPKLGDESAGEPLHSQSCEIHMTNHASLFCNDPTGLPLYEGRMIDQYDYRAKGYVTGRARAATWNELAFGAESKKIAPQWWIMPADVPEKDRDRITRYRIGYGWVASPTNERSLIAALIPPHTIAGNAVPTILYPPEYEWMYIVWLAVANSITMDFLVRMKVSLNLTFTLLNSLPFPRPTLPDVAVRLLAPYVLELSCTGKEMWAFWDAMSEIGLAAPREGNSPSEAIDSCRRRAVLALVDAIVARTIFRMSREELEHTLGTFPIVEQKDLAIFGDCRTKRLVLTAFDALNQNIDADQILAGLVSEAQTPAIAMFDGRPGVSIPKRKIGILAFGSLIGDPGDELKPKIAMRIKTKTPFGVEYGRYSGKTRGGAPTLVPHQAGAPVAAEILVLDNDVTTAEASNMLWRRETRKTGTDATYAEGTSENSVLVKTISNNPWVETLLYADFPPSGKIPNPVAPDLARQAIRSVGSAEHAKDGITYLINAIKCGIETPLTPAFRDEILRLTNALSLDEALNTTATAALSSRSQCSRS